MASDVNSSRASDPPERVRLKVFISYSRNDMAFADELVAGLEYDGGFEVAIDRHSIHEGEDWRARLGALIAGADTIVFVLSPRSAASSICMWEVAEAERLSKRILPVLSKPLGETSVPEQLGALNYVRFDSEDDGRPRSFMSALTALRRALNTDLDWLREHTRLLIRAREWEGAGRPENRLLIGADTVQAKLWLDRRPKDAPTPTELHRDFVQASEQVETTRRSAERKRAEALQRAVTQMRWALLATIFLALFAAGAGMWGLLERERGLAEAARADASASDAQDASKLADERAKEAKLNAELAQRETKRADLFVNLVSSDPAGHRAMTKICREAIEATSALATTLEPETKKEVKKRFWELYFGSMYIVELHQRKTSGRDGSTIEAAMVQYGVELKSVEQSGELLPYSSLCPMARTVRSECANYLNLAAPEPCA
ncbi:MAG: hypothetical protein ACI9DC_003571 [Gammaproteobacteria bacterium]|jgi:hypothetical protein